MNKRINIQCSSKASRRTVHGMTFVAEQSGQSPKGVLKNKKQNHQETYQLYQSDTTLHCYLFQVSYIYMFSNDMIKYFDIILHQDINRCAKGHRKLFDFLFLSSSITWHHFPYFYQWNNNILS